MRSTPIALALLVALAVLPACDQDPSQTNGPDADTSAADTQQDTGPDEDAASDTSATDGGDDTGGGDTSTDDTGSSDTQGDTTTDDTADDEDATDGGDDTGPTDGGTDATDTAGDGTSMDTDTGDTDNASGSECDTDADCQMGDCLELTPGGVRVCETPVPEAQMCQNQMFDECCDSTECASGNCYDNPIVEQCTGVQRQPRNVCASDRCTSDADCHNDGICLPADVLDRPVRTCFPTACTDDTDCTAEPDGQCIVTYDSCCNAPQMLACAYPSGCKTDGDCPNGHCRVKNGKTECASGPPLCPA